MAAPSIEKLREKKNLVQQKRGLLLETLEKLELQLTETFSGLEIFASGRDIKLEDMGLDDHIYGHFCLGEDGLSVAYRDTYDDHLEQLQRVPDELQSYKLRHFSTCKTSWLERLSSSKAVGSLLLNLEKQLDEINSAADESIDLLKSVLEHQAAELDEDAAHALGQENNPTLIRDWTKARQLISLEPAESITRSSSYLESICKHILADMGAELPSKDTISNLIGACLQRLPLSSDEKAGELLQQLIGNFKGIFNSIGGIRNNHGTAHGASPGHFEMGEHEARLVNNAAATASIFLLHRHAVWKKSAVKAE